MNFTPELEVIYRRYENGQIDFDQMALEVDLWIRDLKKKTAELLEAV